MIGASPIGDMSRESRRREGKRKNKLPLDDLCNNYYAGMYKQDTNRARVQGSCEEKEAMGNPWGIPEAWLRVSTSEVLIC